MKKNIILIHLYGKTWRRYPNSTRRSDRVYFKCGAKFLHHFVWEKFVGKRRKGYVIHHKDGNCQNNDLSNLEEITPKEHCGERHKWDAVRYQKQIQLLDSIRHLTKPWHKSADGHKWHREHALKSGFGTRGIKPQACACCGIVFKPKRFGQKFCSNNCKSAQRRKLRIDDIEKHCEYCGNVFKSDKYQAVRFCSRACASKFRFKKQK